MNYNNATYFELKPCKIMALKKTEWTAQRDMFREELTRIIDLRHPLARLANEIDWGSCEGQFKGLYAAGVGRPGYPIRLMIGLQLLKHMKNLSDEAVVASWLENPYWQYFCGEQYFQHEMPIDPSLMTGFRKRIGESGCEFILKLTVEAGLKTGAVSAKSFEVINVDTTVQDKAVAFPTDTRLLNKARIALVRQAQKSGVSLRQSYARVGQESFIKAQRYAHTRQIKQANRQIRKLRTYLGRIIRDIQRKTQGHESKGHFNALLEITTRIHTQSRQRSKNDPPKIYSVHAPEVECLAKGKAHKKYEFGVKVGIVSTNKENFVIGAKSLPGNPYDGHTLNTCLAQAKNITGIAPKEAYVDRGYRGHGCSNQLDVWIAGAKQGVSKLVKRKLKRRNAIEPSIGHMKSDGRLARNFLKGQLGDAINVLLCAAGQNLRKILQKLRLLFAQISFFILKPFYPNWQYHPSSNP